MATKHRAAKLTNQKFTIISNTCVGGVITHNVGEQFRSPTVNLIIYEDQLPYEHKVVFTHKEDPKRWPNNFVFSFYTPEKYESGCLYFNKWKGTEAHHWMDEFDYVRWLNDGVIQSTDFKVVE